MLKRLRVVNLAIVEKIEVEFGETLNVITGETGAGKSVIMGAIEFLLGGKAEATMVRDGAKEAEVEADFGEVVIRRTLSAQGRSRAWVNEESVTIGELRKLGTSLVDMHGPTANQQLAEEGFQRLTLDKFGGISTEIYAKAWEETVALKKAQEELLQAGGEDELELLRYQVNEIEAAGLTEEDETIVERHARAAHAMEMVEAANEITEILGGDRGAAEMMIRLQPKFSQMARHFPVAKEWASEAEELTIRMQELSRKVAEEASRSEAGEESMEALDERLTTVNKLKRKYGNSIGEILAKFEAKKTKLARLEDRDVELERLEKELKAAEATLKREGAALSEARAKAAKKLDAAITENLRDLGFLQAKFFAQLEEAPAQAHGCDRVVFMFEPNPGESARALSEIASSGEIARVMLAVKSVLAAQDETGTLVFDEIDANIGGEVGRIVGEKLRYLAKHHQVIAITHLPQSAAYGDKHWVVAKAVTEGRTKTKISEVGGEERIAEIVRMFGGEKSTGVVRKHAEELLKVSN